jgi:excisionase family DNA binding protein
MGDLRATQSNHTIASLTKKRQKMVIRINSARSANKLNIESRTSVTVKGIANYCLVSESTVRRWIKDGKISSLRLPSGQYRVTAADFKVFLERFGMMAGEL